MAELQHECGIAAIYHLSSSPHDPPGGGQSENNGARSPLVPADGNVVSRFMPTMLLDLQNRGQLAAGITSYNPDRDKLLHTYKQIGTVIEALRLNHRGKFESIMKEYTGRAAIGHV